MPSGNFSVALTSQYGEVSTGYVYWSYSLSSSNYLSASASLYIEPHERYNGTLSSSGSVSISVNGSSIGSNWGSNNTKPNNETYITETSGGRQLSAGQTVSLTFYGEGSTNYTHGGSGSDSHTVSVTATPQAETPSLNSSKTIRTPSESITVSWGSPNGSVQTLNLSVTDKDGNSLYNDRVYTKGSGGGTSRTISLSGAARGGYVNATLSSSPAAGYLSGGSSSAIVAYVNALPGTPVVEQAGKLIDSSSFVRFDLTASGQGKDSGQSIIFQYQLDYESTWSPLDGSTLILDNEVGIRGGKRKIYFREYDGLEGGPKNTKAFEVRDVPELTKVTTSTMPTNGYAGSTASGSKLVESQRITFQLKVPVQNPSIKVEMIHSPSYSAMSSGLSPIVISNYHYIGDGVMKIVDVKLSDISSSILPYGDYCKFRVSVQNGSGYSQPSSWSPCVRKPKRPSQIAISSVTNDKKNGYAKENYFLKQLKFSASLPSLSDGQVKIKSTKLLVKRSNGEILSFDFPFSSGSITQWTPENVLSKITTDEYIQLGFLAIDEVGSSQDSYYGSTFRKTTVINETSLIVETDAAPSGIKPYTNSKDLHITHTKSSTSGSTQVNFTYKIQIPSQGEHNLLTSEFTREEKFTGQLDLTIKAKTLNQILTNIARNKNEKYIGCKFIVAAIDGFSTTGIEIPAYFSVDFIESPYFDASRFNILHNYNADPNDFSIEGYEIKEYSASDPNSEDLDKRMFNFNEGMIFKFPAAHDYNEDIVAYNLYISKYAVPDLTKVPILDPLLNNVKFDNSPLLRIEKNRMTLREGFYYYRYPAFQAAENEAYWFKIEAVDSKQNKSTNSLYSNTFIVNCRTLEPTYSLSNFNITRTPDRTEVHFNLRITDLGGSSETSVWDPKYYAKFPNFERNLDFLGGPKYTPTIKLKISIDSDYHFNPDSPDFQTKEVIGHSPLLSFTNDSSIIFKPIEASKSKIYVRTQVFVSYSLDKNEQEPGLVGLSYIVNDPDILTYLGSVPTMAQRAHCIGINTNSFAEEETFVIETYANKKQIRFSDPSSQNEIVYDLSTGQVYGAIINGGTW